MADEAGFRMGKPDLALKRVEKLVGKWDLKGRTLDSEMDNITGWLVAEWLSGGFFLQQRGGIDFKGFKVESLEILVYAPTTETFSSTVYSNVEGVPVSYWWDIQGDVVTHWTKGSKYTGTFSKDGNVLSGGWRPDEGATDSAGSTYDAIMTRVK